MKLAGISNSGLAIIGVLVAVLWGMILTERSYKRQAQREFIELHRSLPAEPTRVAPVPPGRFLPQDAPGELTVS